MAEQPTPPTPADPALLAILALLATQRDQSAEEVEPPTELILEGAGLPRAEIAKVLNKSPDAVRKVIERARKPKPSPKGRRG